jgi:predicted DNA-binding protein
VPVRKKKSDGDETVRTTSGGRKVSVVLPAELAERVERLADSRGDRLTTTVVRLIQAGETQAHEAIREDALSSLRTELLGTVRELGGQVHKEVQAQAHRFSHLLARTALESIAARLTSSYVLFTVHKNRQEAEALYSGAWSQAIERLRRPSPGVKESLNQIAAGAGEQDTGALADLAAAVRELRQGLEAVNDLAARVEALEEQVGQQEAASQQGVKHLADQMGNLTLSVDQAVRKLNAAEKQAQEKRGGLFSRG